MVTVAGHHRQAAGAFRPNACADVSAAVDRVANKCALPGVVKRRRTCFEAPEVHVARRPWRVVALERHERQASGALGPNATITRSGGSKRSLPGAVQFYWRFKGIKIHAVGHAGRLAAG